MFVRFVLPLALVLGLPATLAAQDARIIADIHEWSGEPLAGVRIEVRHARGGGLVGECRTNGAGGCVVGVPPRRLYTVRVSLADYIPVQVETQAPSGDSSLSFALLRVPPPMPRPDPSVPIERGAIVGEVRSPEGTPIPGVNIEVLSNGLFGGTMGRTNEDGSFRISVIPGSYTLRSGPKIEPTGRVFAEGGYEVPIAVTARNVTGLVILYPRSFILPTVDIRVVTPAGTPVAGADVIHESHGEATGRITSMIGRYTTGPNGAIPTRSVIPGTITITASAIVDGVHMAGIATPDVGGAPLDVVITLWPAAQLTGRVEFVGRQRPLHSGEGMRVWPDPGLAKAPYTLADTNGIVGADGEFVVTGLIGERRLILRGLPGGWRLAEVTHYGQPITDKPIVFRDGEKVSGVVFRVEPENVP